MFLRKNFSKRPATGLQNRLIRASSAIQASKHTSGKPLHEMKRKIIKQILRRIEPLRPSERRTARCRAAFPFAIDRSATNEEPTNPARKPSAGWTFGAFFSTFKEIVRFSVAYGFFSFYFCSETIDTPKRYEDRKRTILQGIYRARSFF